MVIFICNGKVYTMFNKKKNYFHNFIALHVNTIKYLTYNVCGYLHLSKITQIVQWCI